MREHGRYSVDLNHLFIRCDGLITPPRQATLRFRFSWQVALWLLESGDMVNLAARDPLWSRYFFSINGKYPRLYFSRYIHSFLLQHFINHIEWIQLTSKIEKRKTFSSYASRIVLLNCHPHPSCFIFDQEGFLLNNSSLTGIKHFQKEESLGFSFNWDRIFIIRYFYIVVTMVTHRLNLVI